MKIDYKKYKDGLVPAIIQDVRSKNVLMLGFMDEAAYKKTIDTKKVTFYSRSKQRLWTKGEVSGNVLHFVDAVVDCDNDSLLIKVNPEGPTCHTGTDTCWGEENHANFGFLTELEGVIENRWNNMENSSSYIASLFREGINKVAQKVGEEAVEVVIEAKDNDDNLFLNESADLLFHYLVLLRAKGFSLDDVVKILEKR